jgi:hypothetical protein
MSPELQRFIWLALGVSQPRLEFGVRWSVLARNAICPTRVMTYLALASLTARILPER